MLGRQVDITDDAHLLDDFYPFVADLEQETIEVAGETPIAALTLVILGKVVHIQAAVGGRGIFQW